MYFIEQVGNNASLFKGSIFANGQYRDEELRFEFTLNSKFDGFNISRQLDVEKGQLKITNVQAIMMRVRNFWQKSTYYCSIDVTLDTMPEDQSLIKSGPTQIRMLIESSDTKDCFPRKMQIDLNFRDILNQYSKTVYYTIFQLFTIVFSIGVCINQLKRIIVNYQAA